MNPLRILRAATLALIAGAALTACTLGPNFEAPASTVPPVFARTQTLQAPSQPVAAAFNADWWTLFDDPVLNALEQRRRQSRRRGRVGTAAAEPGRTARRRRGRAADARRGRFVRPRARQRERHPVAARRHAERGATQSASGGTPFGVAAAPLVGRRLITSTRPASMRRGNSTSGARAARRRSSRCADPGLVRSAQRGLAVGPRGTRTRLPRTARRAGPVADRPAEPRHRA